jgi:hypothetical protein
MTTFCKGRGRAIIRLFLLCLLFQYSESRGQSKFDILITEIFADPTPSYGLPDKEFMELYNNSSKKLNLKDFELFYSYTNVVFPSFIIEPEEYIIVCRENNALLFESYGRVLGLPKFSLLNGGTKLRLLNSSGELVHQIDYSSSWYSADRDQGYSLEMIDLNYPCKEFGNWTSSSSEVGGTPGKLNASAASNPDIEPPTFVGYEALDPSLYAFTFSEKLDENPLILSIFSKEISINEAFKDESNASNILVRFSEAPKIDLFYEIIFNAISDCSGNTAEPILVNIGTIPSPEKGELLLSEILFNPKSNGADFIELYNTSNRTINLKGIGLSKTNAIGEIDDTKILFVNNQLIEPNDFLVVTENKLIQKEIYPKAINNKMFQVKDLPSYSNAQGEVVLLDSEEGVLDRMTYNEDMHHASIDNPDGISLERVRFDIEGNVITNWQSASSSENYATPGYKIWSLSDSFKFLVEINPMVFTPDNDGLDETTSIEFKVSEPGNLTAKIFDINGRMIKTLAANQYVSNPYSLEWNGVGETNTILPVGYYVLLSEFRTMTQLFQDTQKILIGKR